MPLLRVSLVLCGLFLAGTACAKGIRYNEVQPNRLVLGDPTNGFITGSRSASYKRGYFDVVAHGNPSTMAINRNGHWQDSNAKQLAKLIRLGGWNGKDKIRLISCDVGHGKNSIGEQLSNLLKVPVLAPKHYIFSDGHGRLEVTKDDQGLHRVPGFGNRYAYFIPGRGDLFARGTRALSQPK